jgi:uncharacterized protein (TIGR02117 family)
MVRLRRALLAILLLPVLLVALYAAAGFGLGALSFGGNRARAGATGDIPVFVLSNGYHASLILPLRSGGTDWSLRFPAADFAADPFGATHVMLGWGERDFYMNTRTFADIQPGLVLRALTGLGGAVMHVTMIGPPAAGPNLREVAVDEARYRDLVRYVEDSFLRDEHGRIRLHAGKGYGLYDAFYEGTGTYTLFMTCNEWVGRALRRAGIAAGLWTPFASSLI